MSLTFELILFHHKQVWLDVITIRSCMCVCNRLMFLCQYWDLFLALGKLTLYPITRLRLMLNLRIKEMRWLLLAHYTDRHTELLCRQDISIQLICAQGILIKKKTHIGIWTINCMFTFVHVDYWAHRTYQLNYNCAYKDILWKKIFCANWPSN